MLGGKGYFRGSSILVSGTAGTGKTSLAAHFADATCRRGERCLYFAFEESPAQIMRNMRSIGFDLRTWWIDGFAALSRRHTHRASAWRRISARRSMQREEFAPPWCRRPDHEP